MLGGDEYRVPSNIHFHIACMTEACMSFRYSLKTLPKKLPSPSICSHTSEFAECIDHRLDHRNSVQSSVFGNAC
jgi:hypothetical protein